MNTFKARGIVIKEVLVGDHDKIITILCKEIGKISVSAKGCRKSKSRLLAGTQLFSYSDFVLNRGKKFFYVNQIDLIENFYNIYQDFEKLCYASYFCEILNKVILEDECCDDILKIFLKSLSVLQKDIVYSELVARIFELKLLEYDGYKPEINYCIVCGKDESNFYFTSEGTVCEKCKASYYSSSISKSTIYAMNYIFESDMKKLFSFGVSDSVLKELKKISKIYMNYNYDYIFKSLELLEAGR